jgi:hypothetical protein
MHEHTVDFPSKYHTPSRFQQLLQVTLGGKRTLDYDGIVELVVPSMKCLHDAFNDSYYFDVVKPDEEQFIDGGNSFATYGWEETYISEEKPIE